MTSTPLSREYAYETLSIFFSNQDSYTRTEQTQLSHHGTPNTQLTHTYYHYHIITS